MAPWASSREKCRAFLISLFAGQCVLCRWPVWRWQCWLWREADDAPAVNTRRDHGFAQFAWVEVAHDGCLIRAALKREEPRVKWTGWTTSRHTRFRS
jgi:hypothetical protein